MAPNSTDSTNPVNTFILPPVLVGDEGLSRDGTGIVKQEHREYNVEMSIANDLTLEFGQSTREADMPVTTVSSETWLVEAARRGDRNACDRLYGQYASMVHGILLSRVPMQEVDDLVQDVFLHAFEKMKSLRDTGAFGAWLAMITRNKAYDYHRQKHPAAETLSDEVIENRTGAPDTQTEAVRVLMIIKTLPEAYRETLILRLVEGMNGPEIAERTGLTPASVRVNLHRGMKLLREKFGIGASK